MSSRFVRLCYKKVPFVRWGQEVTQRLTFFFVLFRGRDPESLAGQHLEVWVQPLRDGTIGILKADLECGVELFQHRRRVFEAGHAGTIEQLLPLGQPAVPVNEI